MPASSALAMYDDALKKTVSIDVEKYAPLVKRIAQHMMMRMPACVQVEDLIQAGMIGLLEAAQKYDESQGASFETYAGIRIRGAIIDEMRRGDWAPRSVHRNARRITDAVAAVEGREGRSASDQEIAAELEVDMAEYHSMLHDSTASRLFSFEESFGDDDQHDYSTHSESSFTSPQESHQKQSLKQDLAAAISDLPERERLVLALYYDEELNLKEIGEIIGVSESRVSQIHSQAAMRLRARLSSWQAGN